MLRYINTISIAILFTNFIIFNDSHFSDYYFIWKSFNTVVLKIFHLVFFRINFFSFLKCSFLQIGLIVNDLSCKQKFILVFVGKIKDNVMLSLVIC